MARTPRTVSGQIIPLVESELVDKDIVGADLQSRLNEVARIALSIERETGVPARALIAQWAIESRWGAQPAGEHNYFGMKKATRHEKYCIVDTQEVICGETVEQTLVFADYDSLETSCRDYAWLISRGSRYQKAWVKYQRSRDVLALLQDIAGIYATDPLYARLAMQIAQQRNVCAAVERAKDEIPPGG